MKKFKYIVEKVNVYNADSSIDYYFVSILYNGQDLVVKQSHHYFKSWKAYEETPEWAFAMSSVQVNNDTRFQRELLAIELKAGNVEAEFIKNDVDLFYDNYGKLELFDKNK